MYIEAWVYAYDIHNYMKSTIKIINETGSFRLIDHSISHNQFLYRSYLESGKNKDILFAGVQYFDLPIHMNNIKITLGTEEDVRIVQSKFHHDRSGKIFIVEHDHFLGYIVADKVLIQENSYISTETSIPSKREKPLGIDEIKEMDTNIKQMIEEKGIQYVIDNIIQDTGDWVLLE